MPLWHPQLWEILQTRTCWERKISVRLGAQDISGSKAFTMTTEKSVLSQTYPLGLPWLFCGILMEEAFLNSSWRVSSEAAYERLFTIRVFDSLSPPPTKETVFYIQVWREKAPFSSLRIPQIWKCTFLVFLLALLTGVVNDHGTTIDLCALLLLQSFVCLSFCFEFNIGHPTAKEKKMNQGSSRND